MSGIEQGLYLPPFCCGLFQCEKKNVDVLVQQLDRIAGTLAEVLSTDRGFGVPGACLWLSVMDGLSDQLDPVLHRFPIHDDSSCVRVRECQSPLSCQMLASRRLAPMKEPREAAKRIDAR
jgi:hypothetical protein